MDWGGQEPIRYVNEKSRGWNDCSWREAVVRPVTNAFSRYGLAYRRRGSALKYDFAANYRYVGLDVLDLILRHGHVIRRENH